MILKHIESNIPEFTSDKYLFLNCEFTDDLIDWNVSIYNI